MMDHRSSKFCAAAVFTCNASQAGTVATATRKERRRMISSRNKIKNDSTMRTREAAFRFVRSSHARVKRTLSRREGPLNPSDFAVHVASPAAQHWLYRSSRADMTEPYPGGHTAAFYATAHYSF